MKLPAPKSKPEETLALHIRAYKLPPPERGYRFHPTRRWRSDFAWPDLMIAVEVDGATRGRPVTCHVCGSRVKQRLKNGRLVPVAAGTGHTSGKGYSDDREKDNAAVLLGWRVLRFTSEMVARGEAIEVLVALIEKIIASQKIP